MTTCLKYLVPISCFLFLGATVWPLAMISCFGQSTWTSHPLGRMVSEEVRESRVGANVSGAVVIDAAMLDAGGSGEGSVR